MARRLATVRGALGGAPRLWIIEWTHERGRVTGRVVCSVAEAAEHGIDNAQELPRLASPLPPPGPGVVWTVSESEPSKRRKSGP